MSRLLLVFLTDSWSQNKLHAMFLNTCVCVGYFKQIAFWHHMKRKNWKLCHFVLITLLSVSSKTYLSRTKKKDTDQPPWKKSEAYRVHQGPVGRISQNLFPDHQNMSVFDGKYRNESHLGMKTCKMSLCFLDTLVGDPLDPFPHSKRWMSKSRNKPSLFGGFLKWWYPKTPQNEHFQ